MSSKRFSFKLYPRQDKTNKQGQIPVYARIMADKKIELATTIYINKKEWNEKAERLNPNAENSRSLNLFLDAFCSKVMDAYTKLFIEESIVTAEGLKERIFGKSQKIKTLMQVVEEHNEMFEKRIGTDFSYGSFKNYKTTKKYLAEFIQFQYKRKDLPITEVKHSFCEHYYTFLTTQRPCNVNGANKHIQRLKKIVNYAFKMGYVANNALLSYSLKFTPFTQSKLTWEEIEKLQNLHLHNQTLLKVRDIFIFQCFTGLAYAEVKLLSAHHISKGVDGHNWISMTRTKTKKDFTVPVLKPAQDILNRYIKANISESPIFPVLSNQKMNAALKIIGEIAELSKSLSCHVARHTFATTVTLQQGVPLETVSKMLGHTKISTTQIYAVVNQAKIAKDMKSITCQL